jgi:pyruvate formate lyase activating enzyme
MSAAPTGRVFDVSRGRVDDGPGLRTVVFLKGCPLRCPWCHNPEGIRPDPELAFDAARCIGCGACAKACPRAWPSSDRDAWRPGCTACGRCAESCPARARRLAGRIRGVDELVRELSTDADFYAGTGGGVTFSGGEPLFQAEFLFATAAALRRAGFHVAVETSGAFPRRLAARLAREVDHVLWDLKHIDPRKLRPAIGSGMETARENLRQLLAGRVPVELRVTLVPGFNDGKADVEALARWLAQGPRIPPVRLLGFHRLAAGKQGLFGRPYPYGGTAPTSRSRLEQARRILEREGIPVVSVHARAPAPA